MSCTGPNGEPLERSGEDPIVEARKFPAWSPLDHDFDVSAEVSVPQNTLGRFAIVVAYPVPSGTEAVALWWGQDADDPAAYQDMRWRIRVNGDVRILYPAIGQQAGFLPGNHCPIQVFAVGPQTIYLEADNASLTDDRSVRGRLKGLFRPRPTWRNM